MDNDEIARVWQEHFPKWRKDRNSDQICRHLCTVVRERVRHLAIPLGLNPDQKLQHVLNACRIPRVQFDEVSGANRP